MRIDGIVFRLCAFQLAEVVHDQRGLAFEAGRSLSLASPLRTRMKSMPAFRRASCPCSGVADHDHVFPVIGLKKRAEYGGVGFAEDMLRARPAAVSNSDMKLPASGSGLAGKADGDPGAWRGRRLPDFAAAGPRG